MSSTLKVIFDPLLTPQYRWGLNAIESVHYSSQRPRKLWIRLIEHVTSSHSYFTRKNRLAEHSPAILSTKCPSTQHTTSDFRTRTKNFCLSTKTLTIAYTRHFQVWTTQIKLGLTIDTLYWRTEGGGVLWSTHCSRVWTDNIILTCFKSSVVMLHFVIKCFFCNQLF